MNHPQLTQPLLQLVLCLLIGTYLPAQSIVGDTIFGPGNGFGRTLDYSANGEFVVVGHPGVGGAGLESGAATVYQLNGSAWQPVGSPFTGQAPFDRLGNAVAISADGQRIAVGTPGGDDGGENTGVVRVYDYTGSEWEQVGEDIVGTQLNEQFGARLSLANDGNRLAVGAPTFNANAGPRLGVGRTQVYQLAGGQWQLLGQEIQGEGASDGPQLEISLSGEGDHLAVASSWNASTGFQSGHVRVFSYNDTIWVPQGFELVGAGTNDLFGASVALSADGQRMAVGALASLGAATSPGSVRVFDYNDVDTTWNQVANLRGEARLDFFGTAVALSEDGNTLVVGATGNDTNGDAAGQARVYRQNVDSTWAQIGTNINGVEEGDALGSAVGISADGSRVAIGAPFARSPRSGEGGQVLVYDTDGTVRTSAPVVGQLRVFPNPVSGTTIEVMLPTTAALRGLELYDAQGRVVRSYLGSHYQLDVSGLPPGAYLLLGYTSAGVLQQRIIRR